MKVTFLGSSHGVPSAERYCSCIMIEAGESIYFLDAGAPIMEELLKLNKDINNVKAVFITLLNSVGVNPLLAAAMLHCICGVMCGITPPLGLGMYAGMSLAHSEFDMTFKNNLWWVSAQFVLQVVVLMGWLPILGL